MQADLDVPVPLVPLAIPIAVDAPPVKFADGEAIKLMRLAIDDIIPNPDNPWGGDDADADEGFAGSIQDLGVLQPIRVRLDDALRKYVIVAGERRWRQSKRLGLTTIPCSIDLQPPDPVRSFKECITENLHKRDCRPIRLAKALAKLQELSGYTQVQLADAVQKKLSFVNRKLSLLSLSQQVQDAIDGQELEESTAIEIAKVRDEEAREAWAQRAIRDKLTREEVIALVSAHRQRRNSTGSKTRPLRRLLCRLPGGATLAVTPPDGIPELTAEIIRDSVEFFLQHLRKAIRQQVSASGLVIYFQHLQAKDRKGPVESPAPTSGSDPLESSVISTATAGN